MRLKQGRPWFYALIRWRIGDTGPSTLFTVGNTVYVSELESVSADVMTHERQHRVQQLSIAPFLGPYIWWARYLWSPAFRLAQEAEAYRVQYRLHQPKDKNSRARYLTGLASTLAGPLYGRMIDFQAALSTIRAVTAPRAS